MQPFLYLEGALKLITQEQFKNTKTKIFQVWQQFRGLSKISRHRIWDEEHKNIESGKYIIASNSHLLNKGKKEF